jgi:hypothetical protein
MGGRKAKIAEFHVSYYTVFYLNEKKSRLDVVVLRSILSGYLFILFPPAVRTRAML